GGGRGERGRGRQGGAVNREERDEMRGQPPSPRVEERAGRRDDTRRDQGPDQGSASGRTGSFQRRRGLERHDLSETVAEQDTERDEKTTVQIGPQESQRREPEEETAPRPSGDDRFESHGPEDETHDGQ